MGFDAEYFTTGLADDVASLKDSPFTVEIVLLTGERYNLYRICEARPHCLAFQIYPPDGSALVKYPQDDQAAGMPRYRADMLIVPYHQIARVRITKEEPAKEPATPAIGFSPAPS